MNTNEDRKPGDKIYIDDMYNGGVDLVYFSIDLNETQILVQRDNRFTVINKQIIISESKYNDVIESIYKSELNEFKEYIQYSKTSKTKLLRMIDDLYKEGIINE